MKTCSRCGTEGTLSCFERWDKLCRNCRRWVGPRKRVRAPQRHDYYTVKPKREPVPRSGRSAYTETDSVRRRGVVLA